MAGTVAVPVFEGGKMALLGFWLMRRV